MLLLVGLGNPGDRYADTRHNIGFMAVDEIGDAHGFAAERARFAGLVRDGRLESEKVLLLKPQTYMNDSGRSVGDAVRFFRLSPEDVIVFHDEIDLAPGKLKVKQGGGHAGHNGLRSIIAHIGGDFTRIRLGVGHPGRKDLVTPYVLSDFAKADWAWVDALCEAVAGEAAWLARRDWSRFASEVARRLATGQDTAEKG